MLQVLFAFHGSLFFSRYNKPLNYCAQNASCLAVSIRGRALRRFFSADAHAARIAYLYMQSFTQVSFKIRETTINLVYFLF